MSYDEQLPLPPPDWSFGTWEGARRGLLHSSLASTPAQRLQTLEEMIVFVEEVQAARRARGEPVIDPQGQRRGEG